MNVDTTVDIEALHAAIVADIKAQYPDLATVEFYREERRSIPLPAVLLNLSEMEASPDDDHGTGQLPVNARFEAEIIMGFRDPNVKLEMRKFTAAFAAWLRLRRWTGCVTAPANVIGCYQDEFDPELDQYECWRVEWTQILDLGENEWRDDTAGTTPSRPMYSWAPNIGPGNEDQYQDAVPPPGVPGQ